ncbi:MAG TPA: TIGR03621 family F420-dependent LLM class oxidoreductase [Candidatus Limnocylindrales bacterium]|nr:TIGR03621 family F420-dependent LLM class oxidoreductase [Candidatus Limnocylindrales bacterium]
MRPFRFSVMAGSATNGAAWTSLARRAEDLGYDAFMVPDHLGRQFAPIAALATVAAATTRLRIAPFVFANDFRHPLILAGEAATLDVLSGGRLLLGLGAGWRVTDYRQLGMAYEEPRIRVDRLVESVGIVKRLLQGEVVTHDGPHYQLDRARLAPLPVQRPHPPLIVGGGGPRMLRFAAREADIVGLLPQFDPRGRPIIAQATNGATAAKAALVRAAAGDRWGSIDLNVLVFYAGLVGGRDSVLASARNAAFAAATSLVGTPYVLHGTPARVRDILLRRRDAWGLSSYTFSIGAMESMAPIVEALAGR